MTRKEGGNSKTASAREEMFGSEPDATKLDDGPDYNLLRYGMILRTLACQFRNLSSCVPEPD